MQDRFLRLDRGVAHPETSRPPPERVISGDPVFITWNVDEPGGLSVGLWRSTPGKWRIAYDEWEFCRILEGASVIAEDGGAEHRLGPGDSFVLRPGFTGTWEVLETTLKQYVIRM
jgi:uncharacterized cupin superfamily protein